MTVLAKRVAALEEATTQEWRTLTAILGIPFSREWMDRMVTLLLDVLPQKLPQDELARVVAEHLGVTPDALVEAFRKAKELHRARTR